MKRAGVTMGNESNQVSEKIEEEEYREEEHETIAISWFNHAIFHFVCK